MREFGLVGFPLGHSFSKKYFTEKFAQIGIKAQYLNFEIERIETIKDIVESHPNLEGFNVTIPHKQNIIPLLTEISPQAREIGAVNCVKIERRGAEIALIGYNTDVIGFENALKEFLGEASPKKALILGNGGASKAVKYVLQKMEIEYYIVSRTPKADNEISYNQVKDFISTHKLIINTTPLGTWPNIETLPNIPYHLLGSDHYLFDLVYNPEITKFMSEGKNVGTNVCNGHRMLVLQAEAGWKIWCKE